ncbi:MAG: hypothetical protein JWP87_5003 [Labilithrix sp.]|nr:hypothetical protein [Labilithrix sp.]
MAGTRREGEAKWTARLASLAAGTLSALVFDLAYEAHRRLSPASPDNLVYYNMLLDWWRRGSPLHGHTLLPSPYFVDLVLQAGPALAARDFEAFVYFQALTYASLLFGGATLLTRATASVPFWRASIVGCVAVALYFFVAPPSVNAHAFMQNHTSEVFCGLFTLVFVFRHGTRAGSREAIAYVLWIAVNVASSPFFISTFVLPALAGALLVSGTRSITVRRGAAFVGVTVAAAALGVVFDSLLSHWWWPIRGDDYAITTQVGASRLLQVVRGGMPAFVPVVVVGVLGGAGVVAVVRHSTLDWRWLFVMTFGAVSLVTCVAMPVARGAFGSLYELRYVQEPVFLTCIAVAFAAVRGLARLAAGHPTIVVPTWLSRAAMAMVTFVALFFMKGPLAVAHGPSVTAPMLQCFAAIEKGAGLHAGIASLPSARFLNAARLAGSSQPIVELGPWHPPSLIASENNQLWLASSARTAVFDFIVTDAFSKETLALFRERIGAPSKVFTCPIPSVLSASPDFEIWFYDEVGAQTRLRDMVLGDSMRARFAPWSTEKRVAVDLAWSMYAPEGGRELDGSGSFVWRQSPEKPAFAAARTGSMYLPSGDYQITLRARFDAPTWQEPVIVAYQGARELGRAVMSRDRPTVLDVSLYNKGGPTSGALFFLVVIAGGAQSVTIDGLDIEQLRNPGPDLLRLFR